MASKSVLCHGQVNQGSWCQEWYETASRDAGKRAKALRKVGYRVSVSSMGSQVTSVGHVKMTLVDIRPGDNVDTANLPDVKLASAWS